MAYFEKSVRKILRENKISVYRKHGNEAKWHNTSVLGVDFLSVLTAKKRCFDIVENFPEKYVPNLLASLEASFENASDDEYCAELFRSSFNDENGEPMPFAEFVKEFGIGA